MKKLLTITEKDVEDTQILKRFEIQGYSHTISYDVSPSPKQGTYLVEQSSNGKRLLAYYNEDVEKTIDKAREMTIQDVKQIMGLPNEYVGFIDNTLKGKLEVQKIQEKTLNEKELQRMHEFYHLSDIQDQLRTQ